MGDVCALALLWAAQAGAAPLRVVHPRLQSESDRYFREVLKLALDRAQSGNERGYELREWDVPVKKGRALAEVMRSARPDVVWAMTTRSRESALLPVRIPLDKGLSGWRIPVVTQANRHLFAHACQLSDLARLSAGQGFDWADRAVFRANGLPVETGTDLPYLIKMLAAGRFDYLPRSLAEIAIEEGRYAELAVDQHVILHYPSAVYFFVQRDNVRLARALEKGLRRALDDGSFERLFHAVAAPALARQPGSETVRKSGAAACGMHCRERPSSG